MGTTNWAQIFGKVGADPDEANRRFLARTEPALTVPEGEQPADLGEPGAHQCARQFWTIARRQIRLIVADRAYFIFLALLPFVMGALALTVPGNTGFGIADPKRRCTRRTRVDSDAAHDGRRVHGHRADDP